MASWLLLLLGTVVSGKVRVGRTRVLNVARTNKQVFDLDIEHPFVLSGEHLFVT
jgi:hypothetical protein